MSLPQSTTVLIVGAGPAGVATALSLVHHGVRDIAIVDSALQGENSSRALVIHGVTMEMLDKVGMADGIVARGLKVEDMCLHTRTRKLLRASFSLLKERTTHPYALLLPQIITEKILTEKLSALGINVHRPYNVVGLRQNTKNQRETDVLFEDGQVISAKYVIGADGARSTVCTAAGIAFADPKRDTSETRLTEMILADVTFTREPEMKGRFNGFMSPYSWCVLFNWTEKFNEDLARPGEPIRGCLYRIVCGIPVTSGVPPSSPPREYVQNALNAHGPTFLSSDSKDNVNPIEIDQVVWSARFRTHCAIADHMFTHLGGEEGGVILLVGDAAHIHSPAAGGQGMNLALRDAVFLGKALSKHIYMSASPSDNQADIDAVLREFDETRRDRALGTIKFTKQFLQFVSMPYSSRWWAPISLGLIRDLFIRFCAMFTFWQFKVVLGLSGLEGI